MTLRSWWNKFPIFKILLLFFILLSCSAPKKIEDEIEDPALLDKFIEEGKIDEIPIPEIVPTPTAPVKNILQDMKGPSEIKSEIGQLTTYFCLKKKNVLQFSSETQCSFYAEETQNSCLKKYGISKKSILCLKQNLK